MFFLTALQREQISFWNLNIICEAIWRWSISRVAADEYLKEEHITVSDERVMTFGSAPDAARRDSSNAFYNTHIVSNVLVLQCCLWLNRASKATTITDKNISIIPSNSAVSRGREKKNVPRPPPPTPTMTEVRLHYGAGAPWSRERELPRQLITLSPLPRSPVLQPLTWEVHKVIIKDVRLWQKRDA